MQMTPMIESFVMHFGEMGSRWGFNRTVGQMYALLVISETPLSANQIAEALSVSRGNVSMGLKELQSWQLIKQHHIPGDRKEYYQSAGTIWEMANRVFEERRKREMDPTLTLLRGIMLETPENKEEIYAQQRLQEIHDLLETISKWTSELQQMNPDTLGTLMKLGSGVGKVIDMKNKLMKTNKTPEKKPNKE
jgi:DNA-binding transcriptional regulator GbsR (MarR family)|tara:strand:- start:307 stop:882 length:576 start_codon:yes stop_codon:yes gene_type:complete